MLCMTIVCIFLKLSDESSDILEKLKLSNEKFILVTVHRNDNTDSAIKLTDLFSTFLEITESHNLKLFFLYTQGPLK